MPVVTIFLLRSTRKCYRSELSDVSPSNLKIITHVQALFRFIVEPITVLEKICSTSVTVMLICSSKVPLPILHPYNSLRHMKMYFIDLYF